VRRKLLEGIAPWVISLSVHLGAALLAMTAIVVARRVSVQSIVPAAVVAAEPACKFQPPGLYGESGGGPAGRTPVSPFSQAENDVRSLAPCLQGELAHGAVDLVGIGQAPAGALTGAGVANGVSGPRSSFFGTGALAHHVVYVLDRSGSMFDTFDDVCRQVLTSLSRLSPQQDFHIILFADGAAMEMPPSALVPPSRANKLAAAEFLEAASPAHQTDPIPAVLRAFDLLEAAGDSPGKVIYFLTDGLLPDGAGLLRLIAQRNLGGQVRINTYLFGGRDEAAAAVMRRIAEENGGVFKQLNPERLEVAESAAWPRETKE
jgi:hypothetical protein